jgi:ABC-type proline/glycine betaine transport system substrate-binding protein
MINLIQTRRRVMKMMMLVALVVPILAACNSNAAEKEADMGTVVYALKDIDRMALIARIVYCCPLWSSAGFQ